MSDMKLIMENWEKFLKEAECPPGCEPAKAAQDAAPSAGVSERAGTEFKGKYLFKYFIYRLNFLVPVYLNPKCKV